MTALAAEHRVSGNLVLITVAYAAGATVPLFVLVLLGQRAVSGFARLRRHGLALRRASGVVLLLGAWLFTTTCHAPGGGHAGLPLVDPESGALGRGQVRPARPRPVESALAGGAGGRQRARPPQGLRPGTRFRRHHGLDQHARLAPLSLAGLRGKVVLVDFWTYSCVNCIRTLPYLKAWDGRYRDAGLVIVGVHTPEFAFEHVVGNVQRAVASTASAIRSRSTTATRPGTPGPTSTGRPTT